MGAGQRWVVVAASRDAATGIVLTVPKAKPMEGQAKRPREPGGEVNWVFRVADCQGFYETAKARGVRFTSAPARMPWGTTQATILDLYGNTFVAESVPKAPAAGQ